MDSPVNPNLNPNYMHLADSDPFSSDFELSEYLMLDDSTSPSLASSEKTYSVDGCGGSSTGATSRNNNMQVIRSILFFFFYFFLFFSFLWIICDYKIINFFFSWFFVEDAKMGWRKIRWILVIGLHLGRSRSWRSWMMDSSGGSTERRLSRTAPTQGIYK